MRPRHAWLLALLILHLAVLLAWRPLARTGAPPAAPRSELVFILPTPPAAVPVPPALPRSAAPRMPAPQRRTEAAPITPLPAAAPPPVADAPPALPDPFALPAPNTADAARGAVAGVLQSLRKERPHAFLDRIQEGSAIERALAKAMAGRGAKLEELVLPDGRRMTRVRAGGSAYCVVMDSPAGSAGRDVFRDGVKARTVTCPN